MTNPIINQPTFAGTTFEDRIAFGHMLWEATSNVAQLHEMVGGCELLDIHNQLCRFAFCYGDKMNPVSSVDSNEWTGEDEQAYAGMLAQEVI